MGFTTSRELNLAPTDQLPRFNMPLELGIFLGCRRFGGTPHQHKVCLVLDREAYRYQKFISDISGQDIHSHDNQPQIAVSHVRDWLQSAIQPRKLAGGAHIWHRYNRFRRELPSICRRLRILEEEITFPDLFAMVQAWVEAR